MLRPTEDELLVRFIRKHKNLMSFGNFRYAAEVILGRNTTGRVVWGIYNNAFCLWRDLFLYFRGEHVEFIFFP